jgi:ribosomal protein S18 acetylase RimI-like enzyme
MFFANEAAPEKKADGSTETSSPGQAAVANDDNGSTSPSVQLVMADSEGFLNAVGAFLVDAFWLASDHHQISSGEISGDARMNLVIEQCADLQEKYGEKMGRRLAKASVVGALDKDTKELVGVATLKETLLMNIEVLESEKAEAIAKTAVAQLGPKQRREYKNAPISQIAQELLSPDTKAICVLSNLAVSPTARRRGIGRILCEEIEALAGDWGYDEVHLLVESDNIAARTLYESKLRYIKIGMNEGAPALRVDIETGAFQEIKADTLVLAKKC